MPSFGDSTIYCHSGRDGKPLKTVIINNERERICIYILGFICDFTSTKIYQNMSGIHGTLAQYS